MRLLLTKQAFKLSLKYFLEIIKQLLNSVLTGYEELLRPRFELSAEDFGIKQTSALIIKNYWMRLSRISELFRPRSALSAEAKLRQIMLTEV